MKDRMPNVEGSVNLRDFGGYASELGGSVVRDRLYRCGTLHYLTDEGVEALDGLDIHLICDLRRPDEREGEPTPDTAKGKHHLEVPIDPGSAIEMRNRLNDETLGLDERVDFMTRLTSELTRDHADDYAIMFDALIGLDEGGFLVHCSAGKDRTGVAVALILHALGVPKNTVLDDYLATNIATDYEGFVLPHLVKKYEKHVTGISREAIMAVAGVREAYLEAAYAEIDARFDDVEHYIYDAVGVTKSDLSRLRDRYLQ